jgi:hypothetical protein
VIIGATLSSTIILADVVLVLPHKSLAVNTIVTEPQVGITALAPLFVQVTVPPQLSVAIAPPLEANQAVIVAKLELTPHCKVKLAAGVVMLGPVHLHCHSHQ